MPPTPLHILISPLDWGLGHATRCIPVISRLLEAGHSVTLAGYGRSLILLQKEFPNLESIELQGFSPSYSKSGNMILHLSLRLLQFIRSITDEHRRLKKLISQHPFDVIISDNRYGLWNKNTRNVLITHQVMIKTPAWLRFAEYILYRFSIKLISCFDECWIPDHATVPGLSGDMSHKYPLPSNAKFIGPLSRFQQSEPFLNRTNSERKITAIISGPEPQRSLFEDMVTRQLSKMNLPAAIIGGRPESGQTAVSKGNLSIIPYLASADLLSAINSSSLVICRSGYSSIMDLAALGAKALFVPTPGQTEQIYLAELHQQAGRALSRSQENLDLSEDIAEAVKLPGFTKMPAENDLMSAIADLRKK